LNPANRYNRQHYWLVPENLYDPLQQEAALLEHGRNKTGAKQFLQFLRTETAGNIMRSSGYR